MNIVGGRTDKDAPSHTKKKEEEDDDENDLEFDESPCFISSTESRPTVG